MGNFGGITNSGSSKRGIARTGLNPRELQALLPSATRHGNECAPMVVVVRPPTKSVCMCSAFPRLFWQALMMAKKHAADVGIMPL